jgi:hypothetical protein
VLSAIRFYLSISIESRFFGLPIKLRNLTGACNLAALGIAPWALSLAAHALENIQVLRCTARVFRLFHRTSFVSAQAKGLIGSF